MHMAQLVECVPNFSEGKDQQIIDQITQPILDETGVHLLDVDMGADFNRTVVTMVGEPEQVLKTVVECTRIADQNNRHEQAHGRARQDGGCGCSPVYPDIRNFNGTVC